MTAAVIVVPAAEERDDVNNIIMTTEQPTTNDESNNVAADTAAANDTTDTDTPSFCGVGGLDEMTLLPCSGGGCGGVVSGGEEGGMNYRNSAYSSAAAALPRELISRLSLLPDENTSPTTTTTTTNDNNSTYIPSSLFSCITPDNICGLSDMESQDENDPIPASVLANPNRTICVVTTAALPWRTGTAVNPLLRALYLVRYQREHRQNNDNDNDIPEQKHHQQQQTKGSVALVIPWLESSTEREKLYGSTNKFSNGHKGMEQQELWIKQYAKERCNMESEANELKYIWYPAFYLSGFGSIFPKVDLCNYIPRELVDVAILEEPEHLNWFRMPNTSDLLGGGSIGVVGDDGEEMIDNLTIDADNKQTVSLECTTTDDESITLNKDNDDNDDNEGDNDEDVLEKQKLQRINNNKLGWTHRFQFVVGIVHTNYEEYARQYGIGASLIAAPAIGALSALTMRAYCHQVIKLSNTLPSFAPGKECTCNVHGVRREFLEEGTTECAVEEGGGDDDNSEDEISPVYFIGKLVWAKGFDVMIELQELFRKKSGDYFKVDIYGGGPDETAITRAFHGRNHVSPASRPPPMKDSSSDMSAAAAPPTDPKDLNAAALFANPNSIKTQSDEAIEQLKLTKSDSDVISQYLSLGFETSFSKEDITYVKEHREQLNKTNVDPINILGDLSGKSFSTGVKTSQAVYNIADSSIKNILKMSFSKLKKKVSDVASELEEQPNFVFDPPKSRYEWRRHPIPAKFPGVIDHAQLNNPRHKIFLNPSTSEVLCTTSAEALAMGKFVILPNHPSNEFFLQFTNCLAYDTLEECATKMMWALENEPTPLSPEERRIFTWEAATERLMESSLVSIKEARERASNGMDKTDARIAYWLSESGKIRGLFQK